MQCLPCGGPHTVWGVPTSRKRSGVAGTGAAGDGATQVPTPSPPHHHPHPTIHLHIASTVLALRGPRPTPRVHSCPGRCRGQVFLAQKFVTLDEAIPAATAVAARGGRIVAVGEKDEVLAAHPDATVTDLGAVTCVPGFVESHMHPVGVGSNLEDVDVTPDTTNTMEAVIAAIRRRAEITPEGEWILANGFDNGNMVEADRRPLQASDLDQAAPNHLVKVVSNSGHITYVNSLVLEKAGITALTSNPPNGVIVKDRETGAPTGELQNASAAINALVPRPGPGAARRHLLLAAKECQRAGYTSVFDMACAAGETYKELAALPASEFPVRVRMYPTSRTPGKSSIPEQPHDFGDDRLKMGGVKCWSDGSLQGCTPMSFIRSVRPTLTGRFR